MEVLDAGQLAITSHHPSRALELEKLIRGQTKIPNKAL